MLCVIARPEPEADEQLNRLREAVLLRTGVLSPLHAHITLATYLPEETGAFMKACGRLFRETCSFPIFYERIEVLSETSVIAAIPSPSPALSALHGRLAEEFGSSLDRWTSGDGWYPHTTLVYDPAADLAAVCRAMRQRFIPFGSRISRIELSKVEDSGYTILETFRLLQAGSLLSNETGE